MYGRLCSENTLLEGLAQDLEDVAAELRPCIQKEHTVVGERHVGRPRHLPSTRRRSSS
jgi:hypothetical protein